MAWTKAKTVIVVGVSVLLAAGTATMVVKESNVFRVKSSGIDAYISDSDLEDYQKAPPLLVIQPTHFPKFQGIMGHSDGADGKLVGRDRTIKDLIADAYKFRTPRILFPDNMPTNHYDYLVTVTNHYDSFAIMPGSRHQLFQAEIAKQLGYTARIETRVVDCQVIKVASLGGGKLQVGHSSESPQFDYRHAPAFDFPDHPLSALVEALEYRFRMPVIDQTGLVGKYYMVMDWRWKGDWRGKDREANLNSLKKALFDQFGVDLVSSREPVEMLVVEKVKQ